MTFFDISRIICFIGYLAIIFKQEDKITVNSILISAVLAFSGWVGFIILIVIATMYKTKFFSKALFKNKYKRGK